MGSNFLGDVGGYSSRASSILSAAELQARVGVNLQKSMNYRESEGLLSVFLVLSRDGDFYDVWDPDTEIYTFQGHDSILRQTQGKQPQGKFADQVGLYADGRVADNGKFYKEAYAFKDGLRAEPLQVEIYEKLDAGVWYDKGIFNLIDAARVQKAGRSVFEFYLSPAGRRATTTESDESYAERMLGAREKSKAFSDAKGRCLECGSQSALHFAKRGSDTVILCETHTGRKKSGLLE